MPVTPHSGCAVRAVRVAVGQTLPLTLTATCLEMTPRRMELSTGEYRIVQ